ncbi:Sua5 YciO YrdC YwlC family protein [Helicobacter pametensis]|uniref:Sua5 YciO YrdC YwlC family protein n=1 Tax=Helicobacter pametensis TaxID=95149 RepID=UPI00048680B0|nr:Sua5 YciO YrdC YwlC family protein [Helicobacter pametensis]
MQALFLAQSDTTAGFLCQDPHKINRVKQRGSQKVLIEVDSLATLQTFTRTPSRFKNHIRRSKKTTFIYPNGLAIRVVKDEQHLKFLTRFGWMYSSSANRTKESYDDTFASQAVEVIIKDRRGFFEGRASKMMKLNSKIQKRIR